MTVNSPFILSEIFPKLFQIFRRPIRDFSVWLSSPNTTFTLNYFIWWERFFHFPFDVTFLWFPNLSMVLLEKLSFWWHNFVGDIDQRFYNSLNHSYSIGKSFDKFIFKFSFWSLIVRFNINWFAFYRFRAYFWLRWSWCSRLPVALFRTGSRLYF